ncbi:glycosyltransferase family protein [Chelativorans salis]|uniref:Glycosyltransferase n=1 Tax=Chelativorans salis TaxID=2978478 RepID=A0ABT2LWF3_9HYPH|nr:glycosyltransferase [Chelativorans sp. EGI FJ00035]MCT7378207.1 glycosyltransferase [Chelativorans sp. EGI FJ00035]
MAVENQERALCDYLDELGLRGHCWFIGDDKSLLRALSKQFPGEAVHTGTPASRDALEQCSVLILSLSENRSNEVIFAGLETISARPLIVLLGDTGLPVSYQDRLLALGYRLLPKQPKGHPFHVIEHAEMAHKKHFDVAHYWEKRYASGHSSGAGSYGRLAQFKAHFINHFVQQHRIKSVLELGCGDGAQLALAEYPQYLGLDISPTIIERCRRIFAHDSSKQFEVYDPENFNPESMQAELGLSLDVVYHLSNDKVYHAYLDHLFAVSSRFVIIYSNSDRESLVGVNESAAYVRFRDVLEDIKQWQPNWSLISAKPNRFPYSTLNPSNTSVADFFVFEKQQKGKAKILSAAEKESFLTEKIINTLMISDENAKHIADNVTASGKKIDALVSIIKKLDNARQQKAAEDVSATQEKIDALAEKIEKLDNAQQLQALVAQQQVLQDEQKVQREQLHLQLEHLRSQLERSNAEKLKISARFSDVCAKYRAANARYRSACQQIAALKASPAYKAGSYVQAASHSMADAAKLPVRLWRLKKPRDKPPRRNFSLLQGLRYIKWKAVVPLATRLGLPYSRVARITLPQSVRGAVQRIGQKTTATPSSQSSPNTAAKPLTQRAEVFTPPSPAAQEVSILGWPAPLENGKPLVLAVMDEFTEGCFGSDLRLLQPRPDNWYGLAKKHPPAMVFIESAWKGNGGSWQYRVGTYNMKPGQELAQMTRWARQEGIPSVFWNKEDPVHHDKFMEAAALADHIFTTDQNMVESYKQRTGNQSVYALPFAAQPALHKPAALADRLRKSCFAGSWYGNRHAERGEAMKWLLKTAHKHALDIFDRNYGTGIFPFPEEYQDGIRGSLPYLELCKEYRRYRIFLNVNSVTDSPTMFSRRVFELMACGTPVVSTYARGIEETFQSDAVWLVRNEAEADAAIQTLLNDDHEWRRRSLAGIREVFSGHTYAHRLNSVFKTIGLTERIETEPQLLLLARVKHQAEMERLLSFAENQHYGQFQFLIECASSVSAGRAPDKVHLIASGKLLNRVAEYKDGNYAGIGWISPNHIYGAHYLQDLANAMAYRSDASGWAKACEEDAFSFGAETRLTASIWRPETFRKLWLTVEDQTVSSHDLYCADTEEFTPARQ